MGVRRNAAIFAGLLGALSLAAPVEADALSLGDALSAVDSAFATPSAALAAGFAGGVALTALVASGVALVGRRRARDAQSSSDNTSDRPLVGSETANAPSGAAPGESVAEKGGDAPEPPRPMRGRHFRTDAPPVDDAPAEAADPSGAGSHAPTHAARDYADIAENYVRRQSFRERMARRAEGVSATLLERLGANMMSGVPVIERADGSVGDVGTAWWRKAVGEGAMTSNTGFAADEADLAIPSDFTASGTAPRPRVAPPAAAPAPAPRPTEPHDAEGIALRVARIDEGAYPEHRTVDDLNVVDEWDLALRSLDERIAAEELAQGDRPLRPFFDLVGGADTLDEPDNLEPQTSFIPFKTPAGHPEVVDAESYVDYLIEDEFSKNSSTAARRSSRRFLRVLEGGTQPASRHLADTVAGGTGYVGKHFSAPKAAEA